MIKALFLAVPLLFVSFAHAQNASCDLTVDIFQAKPSEACQKEIMGKLTNEQDKIYARQIFKNWQPLTGYEVVNEGGLFQASNDQTGDFFQVQWLSMEPPMIYVDGKIVVDESKDPSLYRTIEKLFAKADKMKAKSAMQRLLMPESADAAPGDKAKDAFFMFTVHDRTGTAEDILGRASDDKTADGKLKADKILPTVSSAGSKWTNWLPDYAYSTVFGSQEVKCDATGLRLQELKTKLGDKDVTIKPIGNSRSNFEINGYPKEGQTVKVNMARGWAVPDDLKFHAKKNGRYQYTDKGKPKYVYATPCSGKYSEQLNASCKTAWNDMAADTAKFPEVKAYLDKLPKPKEGKEVEFGRHVRCQSVYGGPANKAKRDQCNAYFKEKFPHKTSRYEAGEADFTLCEGKKCKAGLSDEKIAVGPKGPTLTDAQKMVIEKKNREAYQAAMKADPKAPKTNFNAEDHCSNTKGRNDGKIPNSTFEFDTCKAPYTGASQAVRDAYNVQKAGPVAVVATEKGDELRTTIENRLIGAMMMGECCGTASCADKMKANHGIKLNRDAIVK